MIKSFLVLIVLFISAEPAAQNPNQKTWCNPMDIGYRYNWEQINDKISYRSGADPVIVNHKGTDYLFVTISGGYWESKDLLNWRYIEPSKWPLEDNCAPAALSVRDTMYIFQSTFQQRPIFYTTEPETGKLKFFNRWMPLLPDTIGPWDPAIFYDKDTDRWFMYWGSSNVYPIYGRELDHSQRLIYKGDIKKLLYLHPEIHGWERFGFNHASPIKPFIEGAWMTKHNGKYYLQYGAPGTEYNVYANGTYVGDDPLGPFTYAPYNPISYKPGGFMCGAGHGNTFQDNYGNYWNTGTPWIAINWNFERRIAMFPTFFDKDDQMHANTRFGDFPHYLPSKTLTNKDELFTGWMVLSYKKPAVASSVMDTFRVANVTDENPRTFWVANTNGNAEYVTIDLQKVYNVKAVQIHFVDYKSDIFDNDLSRVYTQYKFFASSDGNNWNVIVDLSKIKQDRPNGYFELDRPINARYVKYENVYMPTPNLAVSDIRVFGNSNGNMPETPKDLKVVRDKDERNAFIKWDKVEGAVGYNILWGIKKDKLYQTYQVWADQKEELELRALTVGQDYYFAIEAFNENGVSKVSKIVYLK
ncbi:MAG: coagulation factor 5/8 type domain protein [Ignavibacteria bacterium RIFOXYB2_FULL_35_12]|nr:MAG: coagulation factor 5/8 type domain protein [Ignavibacteria bacterium GWA2_36_19]OGU60402.1 MAG: coagulation factor 5/8 type domain protein [Ignavibacteria bacterium GWF2_35_20]OGU83158.1 MAG: coagulation factor 5/8 type domain protein [Ignavibacteria bacterium RIFOXYA2_FULL_35_9]OGU84299.1 MAG: coagulation factor 5/8 type domain protein [Ignavibacteria bacterium RIFOXYA12_FULL_35_25]OGU88552.1 MAG: coagulation factor 5/8 type domain protein [Ignavibacteria bacterium RIFOXYC12_FULL_35_11